MNDAASSDSNTAPRNAKQKAKSNEFAL
jgi:hypothetical protein